MAGSRLDLIKDPQEVDIADHRHPERSEARRFLSGRAKSKDVTVTVLNSLRLPHYDAREVARTDDGRHWAHVIGSEASPDVFHREELSRRLRIALIDSVPS